MSSQIYFTSQLVTVFEVIHDLASIKPSIVDIAVAERPLQINIVRLWILLLLPTSGNKRRADNVVVVATCRYVKAFEIARRYRRI
jgi:hypothetical protein